MLSSVELSIACPLNGQPRMTVDENFLKDFTTAGAKTVQLCLEDCEVKLNQALQDEAAAAEEEKQQSQAANEWRQELQNECAELQNKVNRYKAVLEMIHTFPFLSDSASQDEAEDFRSKLLERVAEVDEDDELSNLVRSEEKLTTIGAGCLFGAQLQKHSEILQKKEAKILKHNQKLEKAEKRHKELQVARKRKALLLLDDDEIEAQRLDSNKRRRHLWNVRKKALAKKVSKKNTKKRKTADEDFSDMPPVKKRKNSVTIETKFQVMKHMQKLRKEALDAGKGMKQAHVLARTREHFPNAPKTCRIQRWLKEGKEQKWEEIPKAERECTYQISDEWKKALNLGKMRENGQARTTVPEVVQRQLDMLLARSTMGISSIMSRKEEVLIEQIAHTASSMCVEYNKGLSQARCRIELSS